MVTVVSDLREVFTQMLRESGITPEALAERAVVDVDTIRSLEAGETTNLRETAVHQLAHALPLSPQKRERLLSTASSVVQNRDNGWVVLSGAQLGREESGSASRDGLADISGQLARAVAMRWRREEEQRRINDPFPLPVSWLTAPSTLTDHWANILRSPATGTADPLDLGGRLDEIADVYRRIPSGRLVVLGISGSGKSILALRFVLDHLASRPPAEPVPVIFSVGAWNPTTVALRDWLAAQLTRDHPGLAALGPDGVSLASALVESGRILPVLDGFDEMADGLRRPALKALSDTTLPLLLTSRTDEYAATVEGTGGLTSAAAIEMADLTPYDLADYLPRSTHMAGAVAWNTVLAELRDRPHSRSSANLRAVLATPLMVALARTIYNNALGRDPSELLDTNRFATSEALRDHLLAAFIPAVYRHSPVYPDTSRRRRHWTPDRAQRWLNYLATHLSDLGTPDLAWWQLGVTLNRFSRALAFGLLTTLAFVTTMGLVTIPAEMIAMSHGLGYALARGLVPGLAAGLVAGLGLGILHWAGYRGAPRPTLLRVRTFGSLRPTHPGVLPRSTLGLVLGLLLALVLELVNRVMAAGSGLVDGLGDGLLTASGIGLGTGLVIGLMAWLEVPIDIWSAISPAGLLKTSRRNVVSHLLAWALVFGLVAGLVNVFTATSGFGLTVGIEAAFGLVLGYVLSFTAWGQWVVLARIWLPLTGRLPWALIPFLDDACQRGVLRRAGAVYQFRHAQLQDHLARSTSSTAIVSPTPDLGRLSARPEPSDPTPADGGATSTPSATPTVSFGDGASGIGRGDHLHLNEEGERRWLVAELAQHTAPGKEVPLQIQITTRGGSSGVPLRPFSIPPGGAEIRIAVHTDPALEVTDGIQTLTVLPGQDSDVLLFGIRAKWPGLHDLSVRAYRYGTFLGEVRCQISVEPGGAIRGGPPREAELETIDGDPGEVTLQVAKSGPGVFTFQLFGKATYAPEEFQAGDPHEAATRIHLELKNAAANAGRVDPAFLHERLRAHGVQLWASAVPQAIQQQFWDERKDITSFTILGQHDVIPWELLYPVNEGREEGFLCERLPVVRRVFGQERVRELALPEAAFVVPPGSPTNAKDEAHALNARLGPGRQDLRVLTQRQELTKLLERGHRGVLHFACHNTFTAAGSKIAMGDGPFAPIDLAVAAQLRSLRADRPLVFFNACSSAGEISWFGATLGWAPQFLLAGAGAFIGTLWPVRSQSALHFADTFYDQLITHGKPLGQASLTARNAIRGQDGDPTWLAYAVYGSPAATVRT
ncbi:CHAT domain-containing protein [Streptomyces canus]|uniref:CHAT domain-containing protein n=1 Tax=Streptomyces canus TaxID=58343 RepID=UPI003250BA72